MITFGGRTLEGVVRLASSNGQSLALGFEGILRGYCGMMPVLWDHDSDQFIDLIHRRPVVVVRGGE